jgi:hypothetical protein
LPTDKLDYTFTVNGGSEPGPDALTGIRIVNARAGHVMFDAPDHDAAEAFLDREVA